LNERIAAGFLPANELSVEQARDQAIRMSKLNGAGDPVARVEDRTIFANDVNIPIRVYTPAGSGPFPVLVYFHGGGWVVGNLETSDAHCRALANASRCELISVNYRHAPEDKFPSAANDAYAATQYIADHPAEFNGDGRNVAVAGVSAGANLAAVVALMARDRGAPRLVFQLLQVPVVSANFETASYRANAEGYGLTRAAMIYYWNLYLANASDAQNPYASPARADSLRGLAPALVITAEFDPLQDEGIDYASRLKQADVPTTHIHRAGMVHGFLGTDIVEIASAEILKAFHE
jgi:acetyl esterase